MGIIQRYIYTKYSIFGHVYVEKKPKRTSASVTIDCDRHLTQKLCVYYFFSYKNKCEEAMTIKIICISNFLAFKIVSDRGKFVSRAGYCVC